LVGTLFLLLHSKSKYCAMQRTMYCVRWQTFLITGSNYYWLGRAMAAAGYKRNCVW